MRKIESLAVLISLVGIFTSVTYTCHAQIEADFINTPLQLNEGDFWTGSWRLEVDPSDTSRRITSYSAFTVNFPGGDPSSQTIPSRNLGINGVLSTQSRFSPVQFLDEGFTNLFVTIPYRFRFSSGVTSSGSASASTSVTINNVAPTITTAPDDLTVEIGEVFDFTALAADPGVLDVLSYRWDFHGDGSFDFNDQSGQFSYDTAGEFSAELQVSDGDGGIDIESFLVTVVAPTTAGDFDDDGDVDGADFLSWQRGESPSPLSTSDLTDWRENYDSPTVVGDLLPGSASTVPEPTSSAMVFFVAFWLLSSHRNSLDA